MRSGDETRPRMSRRLDVGTLGCTEHWEVRTSGQDERREGEGGDGHTMVRPEKEGEPCQTLPKVGLVDFR